MLKPKIIACFLMLLFCAIIRGQSQNAASLKYFNQQPAGATGSIFSPGLISLSDRDEFGSIFSRDGHEFYYAIDRDGKAETFVMTLKNGEWTKAESFLRHEKYSYNDPALSPDESRLYFISDMPMSGEGEKKDFDIWFVERIGDHWSKPVNAGPGIDSARNEYYVSFTKTGTMYFASNGEAVDEKLNNYDVYCSKNVNGQFMPRVKLTAAVNTENYEGDVFVARDESYLIFSGDRPGGFGRGDLYICFKKPDGNWTPAKNMGPAINADRTQYCPFVTPDGKYLLYTSKQDIYWIDAKIIDELRN